MSDFNKYKNMHPGYLIIIRKGIWGYIYDTDAIIASKHLNECIYKNGICRIEWSSLSNVLSKLINAGYRIATVE